MLCKRSVERKFLCRLLVNLSSFCYYYKRLNLVSIDSETANPTYVTTLVRRNLDTFSTDTVLAWNYGQVIDGTITVSTYDPELETYYVAACDSTSGQGTLFAYNIPNNLMNQVFQTVKFVSF